MNLAEETGINDEAREIHMVNVAMRQHKKFPTIEQTKRINAMKDISATFTQISKNMMDYNEDFIGPIVNFHLVTLINNLTMLHPDIAFVPSSISYNEDMTEFSMLYQDSESDEWVRIDLDGNTYEMTLYTSNSNWPLEGLSNVSIADVIGTLQYLYTHGNAPANLAQPPVVRVDD